MLTPFGIVKTLVGVIVLVACWAVGWVFGTRLAVWSVMKIDEKTSAVGSWWSRRQEKARVAGAQQTRWARVREYVAAH